MDNSTSGGRGHLVSFSKVGNTEQSKYWKTGNSAEKVSWALNASRRHWEIALSTITQYQLEEHCENGVPLIWRLLMPQGCLLKARQRTSGRSHMFFLSSGHSKIFYSWTGWKHECSEARQAHAPSWHLGRVQRWIWSSWFLVLWNRFASCHECKSSCLVYKPCSSLSTCDSVFSKLCLHVELLHLGLISMIITTVLSFSLCSFYIWYHLHLYDTNT